MVIYSNKQAGSLRPQGEKKSPVSGGYVVRNILFEEISSVLYKQYLIRADDFQS